MLKQKRIELKKLPDSKKIDCVTVNIVPFKAGIEDVFKKLSEALVETLQNSIEKDAEDVEQFVKRAQEKLGSNPQSVDEIEAMHKDAMEIETNKQKYVDLFAGLQKKNHMIKQIQGQGMALQELESKWREFDARLGAFNDKIED
jgi:exonuclease VII large subunit